LRDVLEYWSSGALECWKKPKPEIQIEKVSIIAPLLHHSITPAGITHQEKTLKALLGAAQSQVLHARFFIFNPLITSAYGLGSERKMQQFLGLLTRGHGSLFTKSNSLFLFCSNTQPFKAVKGRPETRPAACD